jgi:hypothetical protein
MYSTSIFDNITTTCRRLPTTPIPLVRAELFSDTTCQEMRYASTLNLAEEKNNLMKIINDKTITQYTKILPYKTKSGKLTFLESSAILLSYSI